MKKRSVNFILAAALLTIFRLPLFPEENLKLERESLSHAWFFGITAVPTAVSDIGWIKDTQSKQYIEWWGEGFILDSMHVTGLYWNDATGEINFSLNTCLGFLQWNEQRYWGEKSGYINKVRKDKGYSIVGVQKLRVNMILSRALGLYIDGSIGGIYFHPGNLDPGEATKETVRFAAGGGIGFYAMVPSYSSIIFDFGMDLPRI